MKFKFFDCKVFLTIILFACLGFNVHAQPKAPAPVGPVPNENQMRWQQMEYYAFLHYSTNTYTDQEWGYGDDDPKIFNPDKLDARQWARVCKEAGMKGIIVTAKHHSGFCLWPSKYTEYSVKNSPWKNGQGDIIRDLANACKEYGLKLGIYLSPWDRNHPEYGRPEYITYFRNQLTELLTNYGEIFEIWFDGANGGTGYYGGARENRKIDRTTYYDWKNTYALIRKLQPNIVIWNDGGERGDLRWVGTEGGEVGETNWSLLNATGDVPYEMLHHGVENGDSWVPGEVNTSIRPGWFYHEYEDTRVKTLPQLLTTYYRSFGRNGTLLLNFPIDTRGLIHENDEKAALELAKAVKEIFSVNLAASRKIKASGVRNNQVEYSADKAVDKSEDTYWTPGDNTTRASLTIDLGKATTFNRFMAQEYIRLGQRVKSFMLEAMVNGQWQQLAKATTIGYKRILLFPTVRATQLRFTVLDAKAAPLISNIGIFYAPQVLVSPSITRNREGDVIIEAADKESLIYYTLDGREPTKSSSKYTGAFPVNGKVNVKAIAYDAVSGEASTSATETFDISRKNWKFVSPEDARAVDMIDGKQGSSWFQPKGAKLPLDVIIDLGSTEQLTGFRYLPAQHGTSGIISHYQFFVSTDNKEWKMADEGEFSNINNNPLWQLKKFDAVKGRYIKFRALRNTQNDNAAGIAELEVITK